MAADSSPPPVSRRAVLRTAAWTAPVVAVAVSAPAAAASRTPRFRLAFGQDPLVIRAPAPVGTVMLSVQNSSASPSSGPVSVAITGMAPDGFTVGAVPGDGWSNTGGSSDGELFFTWNGTLEPGRSGTFFLVVQYVGSSPRPVTDTLLVTSTDPDIDPVSLQVSLPADED